jgi:hypothetical protein
MTRLRALFHFDIGELFVREEEIGASFSAPGEPRARVALPGSDPPFVLAVNREGQLLEQPFTGASFGTATQRFLGVRIVQVIVAIDGDLSASEFDSPPGPTDKAFKVWDEAYAIARNVYEAFRASARVAGGQYWIGSSHEEPKFAGLQVLEDLDAGATIPVGYPPVQGVSVVLSPEAQSKLATVADTVATACDQPRSIADTLLADARAIYWPKYRTGQDHQRAVLLAAIATEVKVKERLIELASPSLLPLLRVILDNPRDVTQSVPQLLGKPLEAVAGTSLLKAHRQIWDGVDRLFTLRNRVAHRGHIPTQEEGTAAVHSARWLFDWLDDLSVDRG